MEDSHTQLLAAVKKYKMPTGLAIFLDQNPPLIICSVTASGKNTVANHIIATTSYRETVSHTTRPPREGEVNGQHYWFVDEAKMLGLIRDQAFIEVKVIHGETIYGTSIESYKSIIEQAYKPLLVIDVQGVEEISQAVPQLRPYFILPPSYEEWMSRLHSRGVITEADKSERLASARRELQTVLDNPAYISVVNDKVDEAAQEILSGKVTEESQKASRQRTKELLAKLNS